MREIPTQNTNLLSALGTQKHMCCSRSPPKIMQFEDFIWRDKTAQWIREIKHVSNNICISNDSSLSGKPILKFRAFFVWYILHYPRNLRYFYGSVKLDLCATTLHFSNDRSLSIMQIFEYLNFAQVFFRISYTASLFAPIRELELFSYNNSFSMIAAL